VSVSSPLARAAGVGRNLLGFAPTQRLAALVAIAAPLWLASGWRVGAIVAAIAASVLVLAVIADLALLPAAKDLSVTRAVGDVVGVGDRSEGSYQVQSHWGREVLLTLHDAVPPAFLAASHSAAPAALPARGTLDLPMHLEGRARGEVELGPIALRVQTPLGLVVRTLRYPVRARVVIAPSLSGVRRFRWLAVHHRLAAAGVRDARRRGEGRSFARLRDYVVGDDPRHIDWKATARRGHPITREFTIEQSQTVYVLVDAGRSMTQLAGDFPRFEYALSSALVLADVATTAGDRVGGMVFDDQVRALVPAQRGTGALHALRTALVPVQPSLVEPDYASAFRVLAQRQRKRALLVMLTDVIDARAARALLAHLTRGASRHLALVVALRNETLTGAAALPGTGGADALYASGAAEELIAERAAGLQRMRDAGVIVLDVPPRTMAAAVVSEYLELKARGAL
jgi:uncharacterized protein (DUF58 family)